METLKIDWRWVCWTGRPCLWLAWRWVSGKRRSTGLGRDSSYREAEFEVLGVVE